jgi:membrane protein implicated in regulation of membrane protease activity
MDTYSNISYWMFQAEAWVILGILLVIADTFLGYTFFILPIGVAAFLISLMIFAQDHMWLGTFEFFHTWREILMYFGGLSLVSIAILKYAFQRRKDSEPDINQY